MSSPGLVRRADAAGPSPARSPAQAQAQAEARAWAWSGRGLLFDLDGTLVDSLATIVRHTGLWAARVGLVADHVVAASHGRRDAELIPLLAPWADTAREVHWMHRLSCDDTDGIVAVPGAAELLDGLPPGSWAIVTSAAREVAHARLDAAGLPRPRHLVCSEDVEHGKPDPEGFLRGAGLLGVPPRDCLVLEDSGAGAAAGRAAGSTVLSVGREQVPGAAHGAVDLSTVRARRTAHGVAVVVGAPPTTSAPGTDA